MRSSSPRSPRGASSRHDGFEWGRAWSGEGLGAVVNEAREEVEEDAAELARSGVREGVTFIGGEGEGRGKFCSRNSGL